MIIPGVIAAFRQQIVLACDDYWDNVVLLMHMDGPIEYHVSSFVSDNWHLNKEDACSLGAVEAYTGIKYGRHNSGTNTCEVFNDSGFTSLFTTWSYWDRSTFTDETGKTVTALSGAEISTDDSKFNGASGTGGGMTVDYSPTNFDWWVGPYTIEAWVKRNTATNWEYSPSQTTANLIGNRSPTGNGEYWVFGPLNNGKLFFGYWTGSWNTLMSVDVIHNINTNWIHLAMTHSGGVIRLFADGIKIAEATVVGTPLSSNSLPLSIFQGGGVIPDGYIDELRITKGVARYTSDFTPPAAAFAEVQC